MSTPYSIRARLSGWLAIQTFLVLGAVCIAVYVVANINLERRQDAWLANKRDLVMHVVEERRASGSLHDGDLQTSLQDLFRDDLNFFLTLYSDGQALQLNRNLTSATATQVHTKSLAFVIPANRPNAARTDVMLSMDISADVRMRIALAWTLFACALGGAIAVSICAAYLVGRMVRPLADLGRQASLIFPNRLGQRLAGEGQAMELRPLVEQFNAVLERLESAYLQMEAFNADVAHELRTPLATMMGHTEYALARTRDPETLRETLSSNLEEVQRMTGIVNDMLFLSRSDRGAAVRGQQLGSLAALAHEVIQYHEAEALCADVVVQIEGDARATVDRPLLQRAISNLLSNAIRYAEKGSVVQVQILTDTHTRLQVSNVGVPLAADQLDKMFRRFYRVDASRVNQSDHHGLGLAIVAAIARMHGGSTYAHCRDGRTTVGLTLGTGTGA